MPDRFIKQLTIAAIFIILAGGFSYGIYESVNADPTCYDQIQNQGEEGVDCGAMCGNICDPETVPLEIISEQLIEVAEGEYDFVAQVRNPNIIHGARNVSYDVVITGRDSSTLGTIHGSFYILPVQTKYIIKTPLHIPGAASAEIVINDALWHKVSASDLQIDFPLIQEQHGSVDLPGVRYQVEGTVQNRSDFDFDQVDVAVLLKDSQGEIKAITTTTINTFLSRSQRYFKVTWPEDIPGELTPQVQATTNVFNNSNFIRRYGTQEEFQRY